MRVLHEAGVVLHILDDLTGETLKAAAADCPALGLGALQSASGYHVFSNLPPGPYELTVSCPGYGTRRMTAVRPKDGWRLYTVRLPYSRMHPRLGRCRWLLFLLSDGHGALAGRQGSITLTSPSPPLRVVEDARRGNLLLALNAEPRAELLEREFQDENGASCYLAEAAPEARAYRLREPLEGDVHSGSRLFPVWRVETDWEGAMVLPVYPLLMPEGTLEFTVCCGGRERAVRAEPFSGGECIIRVRF